MTTTLKQTYQRTLVHVGILHHRHGVSVYIGTTYDALIRDVYDDYISEWWDEFCEGQTMPDDPETAIAQYFEAAEWASEFLDIESAHMASPAPAIP